MLSLCLFKLKVHPLFFIVVKQYYHKAYDFNLGDEGDVIEQVMFIIFANLISYLKKIKTKP